MKMSYINVPLSVSLPFVDVPLFIKFGSVSGSFDAKCLDFMFKLRILNFFYLFLKIMCL